MICYRDMTFCNHGDGCACPEYRRLTEKVVAAAKAWWGSDDPPIAQADLCGGEVKT